VTELDATDLVPHEPPRRRRVRWKGVVGLLGLAGLAIAAFTVVGDARDRSLPGAGALGLALSFHMAALMLAAQSWIALFPRGANRRALAGGLYASQLTKYLPAGGLVQAASQVALASGDTAGVSAALRLPVFSLCYIVGALTVGSGLALADDLPTWGRVLAGLGLASAVLLDRRVMHAMVRLGRRFIARLPNPDDLPPQRAILKCYVLGLGNLVCFSAAFSLLLGDLTDISPWLAGAAVSAGWAAGYIAVFIPSGLLIREAVLIATLPGLPTAALVAASVAHRLIGLVAEVALAGLAQARRMRARRRGAFR
jgi:uncharacterized membrane protein YbhN (UPF0104 family)